MREQEEASTEENDSWLGLADLRNHAVDINVHDLGVERVRNHAQTPDTGSGILHMTDVPALRDVEGDYRIARACQCKEGSDVCDDA